MKDTETAGRTPKKPARQLLSNRFVITGQRPLDGVYPVQGNKNAALPLICAALIARREVRLRNIPRILDVLHLLEVINSLGVASRWEEGDLVLDSSTLTRSSLPSDLVRRLRGAILILGAVAQQFGEVQCALPGGCPIGRRSFDVHWKVFEAGGFQVAQDPEGVRLSSRETVAGPRVYLEEASVTATENALLLFSTLGEGEILNPAREPHVLSLVEFLRELGCEIELHPLSFHVRSGVSEGRDPIQFDCPADYIDAGTIAVAAAVCEGAVVLKGVQPPDLLGIEPILSSFGVRFEWLPEEASLKVHAPGSLNPSQITAGPWPLFPTDLVSLAIVLASQSSGLCLIHDWMYEGRMFFVDKLIRMGAAITMCDPHRVLVEGPRSLRGTRLESPDIRAGMALVVAGLCARDETTIEHADVIRRGYENIVPRLRGIGAEIEEKG